VRGLRLRRRRLRGLTPGLTGLSVPKVLPADEALRIFDLAGSYGPGGLVAAPSVLGMIVGINLALFAAWRARAIPVYPLVLNVVGWVTFALFASDAWLPSLAGSLIAIGLAWAGVLVWKMRDQEWDRL
jgi:hypothetical protein